jgi:hypothetical protein
MTRLKAAALAAGLALAALPGAGFAHHSFAMFDFTKPMTLKGTVKEFQWTNPHVVLWVYADPAAAGAQPELWTVELTSPGNLTRQGWTRQSLKAGDKVSVTISPLRDGEHGGGFRQATNLSTGATLTGGTNPGG